MSVFPGWEKFARPQRQGETGCIPTGFEMLLRAAGVEGVDLTRFQEEYDLELRGVGENNFESVATAVREDYPHVCFTGKSFQTGAEKLQFIEERLSARQPVLISLALTPRGGWHIMPVVDANDKDLYVLWLMFPDGKHDVRVLPKAELIRCHDDWLGGKDVAFLDGT